MSAAECTEPAEAGASATAVASGRVRAHTASLVSALDVRDKASPEPAKGGPCATTPTAEAATVGSADTTGTPPATPLATPLAPESLPDIGAVTLPWAEMALALRGGPAAAGRAMTATAISSLVLHAALLVAIWPAAALTFGIGGRQADAIAIEIVTASALESAFRDRAAGAPASMGAISEQVGAEVETPVEEAAAAKPAATPEAQTPPARAPLQPEETPVAELTAALAPGRDVKSETELETPKPEAAKLKDPTEQDRDIGADSSRQQAQVAANTGAVTAVGTNSSPSEAVAAASPGVATRYTVDVRIELGKVLGRVKARHRQRGVVQVAFMLSPDGGVATARISQSSGTTELDQAALGYVHAARFPPPPMGMSPAQLTYILPFEFR